MQYKNLNSLGRAYRAGDVDRSTYIRQRRRFIDAFTGNPDEGNTDAKASNEKPRFDQATTVISSADELARPAEATESKPNAGRSFPIKYLFLAATIGVIIAAYTFFQVSSID